MAQVLEIAQDASIRGMRVDGVDLFSVYDLLAGDRTLLRAVKPSPLDSTQARTERRKARRQESHMPVAAVCVAIVADLVGSRALEDVVRVVGVAELASSLPMVTGAFEIVANGDVHPQIGLQHPPRGCCGFRDRRGGCPHS